MKLKVTIQLLALSFLMPISAAHAYIDAASVSMALQVIIGSVAAAFIAIKVYFHRVISLFRPERTDEAED